MLMPIDMILIDPKFDDESSAKPAVIADDTRFKEVTEGVCEADFKSWLVDLAMRDGAAAMLHALDVI